MPIPLATPTEVEAFLAGHPAWHAAGNSLQREFRFSDFAGAFAFMTQAALLAERQDHHPDWCNRYNRVQVTLTTHEAGGITARDFALATAMDEIAGQG